VRRTGGLTLPDSAQLHTSTSRRITNLSGAVAPPAVVQTATKVFGGWPAVLAFPGPVTSGNLLVAFTLVSDGSTRTITDSQSNTWTTVAIADNPGTGNTAQTWAKAGASGSLTVTAASPGGQGILLIYEISGVTSVSPVDQTGVVPPPTFGHIVCPSFAGLAGVNDFVAYYLVNVPATSVPTGGIWTDDLSGTISGGDFSRVIWAVTGPNATGPSVDPANSYSQIISGVAYHP
jgi:hypothetical protein